MEMYHIYNRGNHKEQICFDVVDLRVLRKMFLRAFTGNRWDSLISLCIMPNHYHILLATEKPRLLPLSMRDISRNYTAYMNKKHGLVGHIFQGSYQKRSVEHFMYFRTLVEYIRNNPKELTFSKHLSFLVENEKLVEYYDFLLTTKNLP